MTSLIYIIIKSFKNSLLELLKKPGKLIIYVFVIAALAGFAVMSVFAGSQADSNVPMFWFTGILFLFITLFVVISVAKGLSGGDAIFDMNDVNLLFVSPVNPRKILLYGIVRMAKAAFAASFFILFQVNSLTNFGIDFGGVILVFAGFLLSVVVLTIISLLIYSVTNGRAGRKRLVKILTLLLFCPLAAFIAVQYLNSQDIIAVLESALRSPFLLLIPVSGWTAGGVTALLSGDTVTGLLYLGLNMLLGAGVIVYIMFSKSDYYEDVLVATETAFEKKRALSEGNVGVSTSSQSKKPVKITKTGISGVGASALFGKHIRESFRENRFGFLTLASMITVAGAILISISVRDLMITVQILAWIQILLIGTGRGLKETYSHYIYLIPDSSFKKILWSNMEVMLKTLIENILIFVIAGLLLSANIFLIMSYIVVYTLFSFLLLGINYLSMRFTGADMSTGILVMIYYVMVIIVMIPGILMAVPAGITIGGNSGLLLGLIIMSAWELAAGLGCFALSKGVLHNCDMEMMRTNK